MCRLLSVAMNFLETESVEGNAANVESRNLFLGVLS